MLTLLEFLGSTPAGALRSYFSELNIDLPPTIPWSGKTRTLGSALAAAVEALPEPQRAGVVADAQRVVEMADEPGEAALYSCVDENIRGVLDHLANRHERALHVFKHVTHLFQRAEQVRHADMYRRGRSWSGYVGGTGGIVSRDPERLKSFKLAVAECLRSRLVEAEVYDRTRVEQQNDVELVQVTIYSQGRPETRLAFVRGMLDRVPDHRVLEASLTYSPGDGVIEVVAKDREMREPLVRLLAEHLLGMPISGEKVTLRRYRLDGLCSRFDFPTDPEDNIEDVRLLQLRLMPLEGSGERITLECLRDAPHSIWKMADERFGQHNPLAGGYTVTQARLSVRFFAQLGGRGARTLTVQITMPQGCDLKDRDGRQRLVGEKYLARWGLVQSL